MSPRLLTALMLLASLGWAGSAVAEQPLFLPARDVSVTYRLVGGASQTPREAHMYFSAIGQKLRLDQAMQNGYAVIDRAAKTVLVVITARQQYATLPFDENMTSGFILNDRMRFARTGADLVAGLHCTTWSVQSARATGSACITDDGVMLRGTGTSQQGSVSGLEATTVTYAPQPPSLFTVPPGFTQVQSAPPKP